MSSIIWSTEWQISLRAGAMIALANKEVTG